MARELKTVRHTVPPQNLEAEESVLGAMMISSNYITEVVELLKETDFYRESHRHIYHSIVELYNQGEPVDPITVSEHLASRGVLEDVGGKPYIHTLVSTVPAAANAASYATIVRENSVLRALVDAGSRIAELGYERPGEVREILDRCEKMVFDISQHQIRGGLRPLEELLTEQFERIEKLHATGKTVTGVPTGFIDLDKLTSGFQPSNLIILAARPSMGKTSLALDIAQNVALKGDNTPVVIFSLEMSGEELAQRMMCNQGRVDSHRLRTGRVGPDDWAKLTDACARLIKAPIFVDDTPINMLEMRAKTRRWMSKHPVGLIIVDYLQLMTSHERAENRQQEVAKMSRSLKIMAREFKVPVLALSQLSRAPESRNPPRPVLSDVRDSGAIEQDADLVMFIYRPLMDNGLLDPATELLIAKHRNGPTGKVELVFQEKYTSFSSAAPAG